MKKQQEQRVLLGYEIGTGNPVEIPLAHMVVTGLTQQSGKTTTLKALISRSPSRRAVAFITKRSEGTFPDSHPVEPYFAEQADWQFVESLLEATMRQRMKFERAWIMRVTRGARNLEDVYRNLQVQLNGDDNWMRGRKKNAVRPATGMNADIYMQLSAYFDILLPQVAKLRLRMANGDGAGLQLRAGLNVMDLTDFSMEMQSLVIASTIDACYQMESVTVVIPEAWEFLPQSRKTPVMRAAEGFVRKGAAAQNFLWLDSQDISGIEKTILKQASVWILGNQREINEVEHTLKQLPLSRQSKPKPEDVMHLNRGEFFACFGQETRKVYVCPQWLTPEIARRYATMPRGAIDNVAILDEIAIQFENHQRIEQGKIAQAPRRIEERPRTSRTRDRSMEDTNVDYKAAYEELKEKFDRLTSGGSPKPAHLAQPDRLAIPPRADDVPVLELDVQKPELNVTVRRFTIRMSDENANGKLATLLFEGFFDQPKKVEHINTEFRARGWMAQTGRPQPMGPEMAKLAELGFVRVVGLGTYQSVPGMKVNIKETEVAA